MKWAVNLYTTEHTKKKLPWIFRRTRKNKVQPNVYFITIASNEKNLLDIFHSSMYLQPIYRKLNPMIVGVAEDYDLALELAAGIVSDVWKSTGGFGVRDYFTFKE